jgi:hypothetical protein
VHDLVADLLRLSRVPLAREQHLAARTDPGERVANLVRHVRRHLADRRQSLLLDQTFPHLALSRDIQNDADRADVLSGSVEQR